MTRIQIIRAGYSGAFLLIAGVAASAGPYRAPKVLEPTLSSSVTLTIPPEPSHVTLHAPVVLTIQSGEITLEGGSIAVGPDGQAFAGGTITIVNGRVKLSTPKGAKP